MALLLTPESAAAPNVLLHNKPSTSLCTEDALNRSCMTALLGLLPAADVPSMPPTTPHPSSSVCFQHGQTHVISLSTLNAENALGDDMPMVNAFSQPIAAVHQHVPVISPLLLYTHSRAPPPDLHASDATQCPILQPTNSPHSPLPLFSSDIGLNLHLPPTHCTSSLSTNFHMSLYRTYERTEATLTRTTVYGGQDPPPPLPERVRVLCISMLSSNYRAGQPNMRAEDDELRYCISDLCVQHASSTEPLVLCIGYAIRSIPKLHQQQLVLVRGISPSSHHLDVQVAHLGHRARKERRDLCASRDREGPVLDEKYARMRSGANASTRICDRLFIVLSRFMRHLSEKRTWRSMYYSGMVHYMRAQFGSVFPHCVAASHKLYFRRANRREARGAARAKSVQLKQQMRRVRNAERMLFAASARQQMDMDDVDNATVNSSTEDGEACRSSSTCSDDSGCSSDILLPSSVCDDSPQRRTPWFFPLYSDTTSAMLEEQRRKMRSQLGEQEHVLDDDDDNEFVLCQNSIFAAQQRTLHHTRRLVAASNQFGRDEAHMVQFALCRGGFERACICVPCMHITRPINIARVIRNLYLEVPAREFVFDMCNIKRKVHAVIISSLFEEALREFYDNVLSTRAMQEHPVALLPTVGPFTHSIPRVFFMCMQPPSSLHGEKPHLVDMTAIARKVLQSESGICYARGCTQYMLHGKQPYVPHL